MPLYQYRCAKHGEQEVFVSYYDLPFPQFCEVCEDAYDGPRDTHALNGYTEPMRRVYTPPVTDCRSFGKNQYGARTPAHLRRPRSEDQARDFRDAARVAGARRQYGPGKTTGS